MFETLPNRYAGEGGHTAPPYLIVSKAIKRRQNLLSIKYYFSSTTFSYILFAAILTWRVTKNMRTETKGYRFPRKLTFMIQS